MRAYKYCIFTLFISITSGVFGQQGIRLNTVDNSADINIKATAANPVLKAENLAGNTIVHIKDDGNAGIGTATPAYTLDVSGSVQIRGDLVEQALELDHQAGPTTVNHGTPNNSIATQSVYVKTGSSSAILINADASAFPALTYPYTNASPYGIHVFKITLQRSIGAGFTDLISSYGYCGFDVADHIDNTTRTTTQGGANGSGILEYRYNATALLTYVDDGLSNATTYSYRLKFESVATNATGGSFTVNARHLNVALIKK